MSWRYFDTISKRIMRKSIILDIIMAVHNEPEFSEVIPDNLYKRIQMASDDKEELTNVLRSIVRATKKGITCRIRNIIEREGENEYSN